MANQKEWKRETVKINESNNWTYDRFYIENGAVETNILKIFATQTISGREYSDLIFKAKSMLNLLSEARDELDWLHGVNKAIAKDVVNGQKPVVLGVQHLDQITDLSKRIEDLISEHE